MSSDLFVGKPLHGDQISSWGQTGGSLCPPWRSDLFVGASKALLCVEIRLDPHAKQGKGENSRQIKDEDLLCVGASRPEERGNQPTHSRLKRNH